MAQKQHNVAFKFFCFVFCQRYAAFLGNLFSRIYNAFLQYLKHCERFKKHIHSEKKSIRIKSDSIFIYLINKIVSQCDLLSIMSVFTN